MYDTEIKLSNICSNWFEYYYRHFVDQRDIFLPIDKKLSKMMDEELLQYFSVEKNTRKYLSDFLNLLSDNPTLYYSFSYTNSEEQELKEIVQLASELENTFNVVLNDIVVKNLMNVNNTIEVFKAKNNGTLVVNEQVYYKYWQRKLGIHYTYDTYQAKNEALKKKIVSGGYFTSDQIKVLSVFCDSNGYMWMPIWKNIDNVEILETKQLSSNFENENENYIGKYSGDLLKKNKLTIMINGVKFSTITNERIDTNGFW